MRVDRELLAYYRAKDFYEQKNRPLPTYLENTYNSRRSIIELCKWLEKMSKGNALSKADRDSMEKIVNKCVPTDMPKELEQTMFNLIKQIKKLKEDMDNNQEIYFLDDYNLTKIGRKRISQVWETALESCKYVYETGVIEPRKYALLSEEGFCFIKDVDYENKIAFVLKSGEVVKVLFDEIHEIATEVCKNIIIE